MGCGSDLWSLRFANLESIGLPYSMSSLSLSCPARAGLYHSALLFCKLIPTIRPFRIAQWYNTSIRRSLHKADLLFAEEFGQDAEGEDSPKRSI
ncbi:hypothetical protein [Rubritalea tangerina]|uniref:hypothetical protein n=1 Tax=Rubritalea tangerina TaxID=430798 RepID=UPI003615F83B